jgi:hypothetical protein
MRSLGLVFALCLVLFGMRPAAITSSSAYDGHDVTVRIEALGKTPVVVHLSSPDSALRLVTDSTSNSSATNRLTVRTPALVFIGARAGEVQVVTERDMAVQIKIDDGASARERAQHTWGRQLLFRRSRGGDLVPQAQALQLLPVQ